MATKEIMEQRQEELFRLFKMAIAAEQEAQQMYKKAADCCDDKDIRVIFQNFVIDEAQHETRLIDMYKDFKPGFVTE